MSDHQMIYVFWDGQKIPEQLTVVNASGVEQNLSLDELRALNQSGAQLYLVLSSKSCSIYQIELPKLSAKELPLAIQSVLEDKVLQSFTQLWWCYYKNEQGLYDIFVWDKAWLENIRNFFTSHDLSLSGITLDWFALKPREILVLDSSAALIRSDDTNAFLSAALFSNWLMDKSFESHHIYSFQKGFDMPGAMEVDISYPVWIWQRFQEKPAYDIDTPVNKFDLSQYLSREQVLEYFPKVCLGSFGLIALVFLGLFVKNIFIYFDNLSQFKNFSKSSVGDLQANLSRYQFQNAQKKQFWSIWVALQKSYQEASPLPKFVRTAEVPQVQVSAKNMDVEWVRKQNPKDYTIMIASNDKPLNVSQALMEVPKNQRSAALKYEKNGQVYYTGVYGNYLDQAQAQETLNNLPADVRKEAQVVEWNRVQYLNYL